MKYLFSVLIGLSCISQIAFSQAKFSYEGNPCIGEELTFYNESTLPADSVMWTFGNGDSSTNEISVKYTYNIAGSYNVLLSIISGGVVYSIAEVIEIHELPVCDFVIDTVNFSSYSRVFIDQSQSDTTFRSFRWDFGNGEGVMLDNNVAEYKYSKADDYEVWLWSTDNYGCTDSSSRTITVSNIYRVPNVFTPNEDGINDQFIVSVNGVETFSIEIYSRWGSLVFKRDKVNQVVWDGRMPDGSKVTPGTYYYVIAANDSQEVYDPESGFISVFYGKDE